MSGGMQPSLFLRYLPVTAVFQWKTKAFHFEMLEPVVEPSKVDLLLLVMRLAGTEDIEAAGLRTNTGQLI